MATCAASSYPCRMAGARSITVGEVRNLNILLRLKGRWSFLAAAYLCALAMLLAPAASASAQRVPTIPLLGEPYEVEPAEGQARFLIIEETDLPPKRIMQRLDEFTLSSKRHIEVPSPTLARSDVWLHFRVVNASDAGGTWVVDLHRPVGTIMAEGFAFDPGKPGRNGVLLFECVAGSCEGAFGSAYVSGALSLGAGESRDILIRYPLGFSSQSPVRFVTPMRYLSDKAQRDRWAWMVNGIWIGMIALALLFQPVIGWPLSISFAGYSATAMLLVNISGASINLSGLPFVVPFIEGALLQFGLILFLQFGRTFFATRTKQPQADRAMRAIMVLSAFNLVLIVCGFDVPGRIALQLLSLAALGAQITVATRALIAGWSGALPIFMGTVLIAMSFLVDTGNKVFGGLIHRDTVVLAGQMAFFVEAICFALAIAAAVLRIQGERDAAVQRQLAATKEKLALAGQLQTSQRKFERARSEAERHRHEIEALGHDLMQPLQMLKQAFRQQQPGVDQQSSDTEAAFSFLEGIASKQHIPSETQSAQAIETFPIAAVIDNTRRMFEYEAAERGIELKTVQSTQIVRSDPITVLRVVSNLVSNAIRHSRAQRILIGCRLREGVLSLEVHDDGIGIEAHQLERYLARGGRSPDSEGHGLGLAIARSLCGRMGLRFGSRSVPGRGCVFAVELPLESAP